MKTCLNVLLRNTVNKIAKSKFHIYSMAIKQEYESKSAKLIHWDPSERLAESGSLVGTFDISAFFIYVLDRSE